VLLKSQGGALNTGNFWLPLVPLLVVVVVVCAARDAANAKIETQTRRVFNRLLTAFALPPGPRFPRPRMKNLPTNKKSRPL